MRRVIACTALSIASSAAHGQAIDNAARGLAAQAQATANAAIPKTQIGVPNGVAGLSSTGTLPAAQLPYVSVTKRAPLPTDDGTGLANSTGPCAIGDLWEAPSNGSITVYEATSCVPGNAHWPAVPNPGLVLDAVPGGHGWATFQAARAATAAFHLTDGGSNGATINFLANGLADYASADKFVATTPVACANIPDYVVNGSNTGYCPSEALVDITYDQSQTGTPYNSTPTTGIFLATIQSATGVFANNDTITFGTLAGCTSTVETATMAVAVNPLQSPTGTLVSSNTTVAVSSTTGLVVGELVQGTGLPAGDTISSIGTGSIVLSLAPTASGTVTLSAGGPQNVGYAVSTNTSLTMAGECAGGTLAATQTMSATSGAGSTSVWSVTPYSEAPIWIPGDNTVGPVLRGEVLNSVPAQLSSNQINYSKVLYIPNIPVMLSQSTMILVMRHTNGTQYNGTGLYEAPSTGQALLANTTSLNNIDTVTLSGSKGACNIALKSSPGIAAFTWQYGSLPSLICRQDNRVGVNSAVGGQTTATTGLNIGTESISSVFGHFTLAGAFLWTTPLTSAQLETAMISLTYSGQFSPQSDTAIIITSDSMYSGSGDIADASSPLQWVAPFANRPYDYYNAAVHGEDMAAFSATGTAHYCGGNFKTIECGITGGQRLANRYDPTLRETIVAVQGGPNDIRAGTPVSQIESSAQNIVATIHSNYVSNIGTPARVMWIESIPQCDIVNNAPELAAEESYDYWLETQAYVSQASGGLGLTAGKDVFVPMAPDPILSTGYLGPVNGSQLGSVTLGANAYCGVPVVEVGTLTSGSATITGLPGGQTSLVSAGETLLPGNGIPNGTTIASVTNTTIVLSALATATNTNQTIVVGTTSNQSFPTIWSPEGGHQTVLYMKQWSQIIATYENQILN